jgi:hypothetical protein
MSSSPMPRMSCGAAGLLAALLLFAAPAFAGPPYRTDDPEPVEFQHFEINAFSFGTKTPCRPWK